MLVALLVPFPAVQAARLRPALFRELENLCHPIVFGVLTWSVLRVLQARSGTAPTRHALWLLAGMATFGASTELLQHFTGRDASWVDLRGDVIGAAIPLALSTWPRRRLLTGLLVATLAMAACAPLGWTLLAYAYRNRQEPLIWQTDSARLGEFAQWQQGDYPGLTLDEVPPDWRDYRELLITVSNPNEAGAEFSLMAYDHRQTYRYEDSYKRSFQVPPHTTQTFQVPIEDIRQNPAGRAVDLQAMGSLVVFQINKPELQRIQILRISLSR